MERMGGPATFVPHPAGLRGKQRVNVGRFLNFAQLRKVFPHADQVGKFTVFNIAGNKVRLIAAVHYNRNKIYIRHVLTHQEYDAGKWKE